MTEMVIHHRITLGLDPAAQSLLGAIAEALTLLAHPRRAEQPPSAGVTPPVTEVPGVSAPLLDVSSAAPSGEMPSRGPGETHGGAATHPRLSPPPERKTFRSNCWTGERVAILRRDYPAGVAVDTIYAQLTALPGLPIHRDRIATKASYMGLKRPFIRHQPETDYQRGDGSPAAAAMPAAATKATRAEPHADAKSPPNPPAKAAANAPRPSVPGDPIAARSVLLDPPVMLAEKRAGQPRLWSPERDETIKHDYPRGVALSEILWDLNQLDGPEVTRDQIALRAVELGLTRPMRQAEPKQDRKAIMRTIAEHLG